MSKETKILDSNSRQHYCVVLMAKRGWAQGGGRQIVYRKGLDVDGLAKEMKAKMISSEDEILVWKVSGGAGLTYRIDANGRPVNIGCELVNTIIQVKIGGEDGE